MSERISIKEVEYLQKKYKVDEYEIIQGIGVFFYHKGEFIFPIFGDVDEHIESDGKLILMLKGKHNWPRESIHLFFEDKTIPLSVGQRVLLNQNSFLFNSIYYLTQMNVDADATLFFEENAYVIRKIINPICVELIRNGSIETVLLENILTESDFLNYINEQRNK